ncbi:MAG: peptide chain release factor N(5)-glutamine methyltransferase [Anaerolineaceae bacterium]|nr:peptide chain release factor N(5)-glutamine methyltransferase [Anaerolineaceae bacterium]
MADETPTRLEIGSALSKTKHSHQVALALMAYVLQKPKTWLLAHPETPLSKAQSEELQELLARLDVGVPLPYLTGRQEFFGLEFEVNPSVLIPRPETEVLVEAALGWLQAHPQARKGIDVGTGSGCIAVSLASHCPDLIMVATDISPQALEVATRNADRHHVAARVSFCSCDMLPGKVEPVGLLCANLPYIPTAKLSEVESLPWEPELALDGGKSGLELIDSLLARAPDYLTSPGLVLLETEATLGSQTLKMAKKYFPEAEVSLQQDLSNRDRLIRIEVK